MSYDLAPIISPKASPIYSSVVHSILLCTWIFLKYAKQVPISRPYFSASWNAISPCICITNSLTSFNFLLIFVIFSVRLTLTTVKDCDTSPLWHFWLPLPGLAFSLLYSTYYLIYSTIYSFPTFMFIYIVFTFCWYVT